MNQQPESGQIKAIDHLENGISSKVNEPDAVTVGKAFYEWRDGSTVPVFKRVLLSRWYLKQDLL